MLAVAANEVDEAWLAEWLQIRIRFGRNTAQVD